MAAKETTTEVTVDVPVQPVSGVPASGKTSRVLSIIALVIGIAAPLAKLSADQAKHLLDGIDALYLAGSALCVAVASFTPDIRAFWAHLHPTKTQPPATK